MDFAIVNRGFIVDLAIVDGRSVVECRFSEDWGLAWALLLSRA